MIRRSAALVFTAALLCGCANAPPSQEQLDTASYGEQPSAYEAKVKKAFTSILINPEGASYEFESPEKGWGAGDTGFRFGWVVWARVNSKNRFGEYAGWSDYKVLLYGNRVVGIYEPAGKDLFGHTVYRRLFSE